MNPRRVQGAFASDEEIEAVCGFWRAQGDSQHTADDEAELEKLARQEDPEERLLAQARQILNDHDGEVTPGYLARKLKVGMQKAKPHPPDAGSRRSRRLRPAAPRRRLRTINVARRHADSTQPDLVRRPHVRRLPSWCPGYGYRVWYSAN